MLRPDGQPGIYGVVEFKNRAVGVLPVDDEGRVWLVGQYRYPLTPIPGRSPRGASRRGDTRGDRAARAARGDRADSRRSSS